jgi:excisionase family DNA binding protein
MARRDVLTTWEAARYCAVSPYTIRRWILAGRLRAYSTPGGHRRIRRPELDEFLKAHNMPLPEDFREGKRSVLLLVPEGMAGLASLVEAFSPDLQVRLCHQPFLAGFTLAAHPPDLMLVDVDQPRWGGIEPCQVVRDSAASSRVRVAALTSRATVEVHEALDRAGVLAVFAKPADPAEILMFLKGQFPTCRWKPTEG